jgi:ADP-ribosylglycohydrolase
MRDELKTSFSYSSRITHYSSLIIGSGLAFAALCRYHVTLQSFMCRRVRFAIHAVEIQLSYFSLSQ